MSNKSRNIRESNVSLSDFSPLEEVLENTSVGGVVPGDVSGLGFGQSLKICNIFSNEFGANYAILCDIRRMRAWSNAKMGSACRNVAPVRRDWDI